MTGYPISLGQGLRVFLSTLAAYLCVLKFNCGGRGFETSELCDGIQIPTPVSTYRLFESSNGLACKTR